MNKIIQAPIRKEEIKNLKAGDYVYINGIIYTARDAAHKRMDDTLTRGEKLPLDIKNQMIYYMGPSPAREGRIIGSAGLLQPVVWINMHLGYWIWNLGQGQEKGKRSKEVLDAIVRNGSIYFAAVGGAGALLSKCIQKSEVIAYDDLGTEAIRKLEVKDFPVIVVVDAEGNNLYETAIEEYKRG